MNVAVIKRFMTTSWFVINFKIHAVASNQDLQWA
jgi:hypothetical protein